MKARGFTLIELMVVIAIAGIVIAIVHTPAVDQPQRRMHCSNAAGSQ